MFCHLPEYLSHSFILQIHDVPSDPRGAGRCAFANRDIERGEIVVEYQGEHVSLVEAASTFNDHQGANFALPGVFLLARGRFYQGNMLPLIFYYYFTPLDVAVCKRTATCPSGATGNIMDR